MDGWLKNMCHPDGEISFFNDSAFDVAPRMQECMPGETSDKDGELGYCWMHHFKCHSARTCRTWAKGGPITKDDVSHDWQDRNKFPEE